MRGKLRAQPKRPRPSHAKKAPKPCPHSKPLSPRSSTSRVRPAPPGPWSTCLPRMTVGWACCRSAGDGLRPAGYNLWRRCGRRASRFSSTGPSNRPPARVACSNCRPWTVRPSHGGWPISPPPFRRRTTFSSVIMGRFTKRQRCTGLPTSLRCFCPPTAPNCTRLNAGGLTSKTG